MCSCNAEGAQRVVLDMCIVLVREIMKFLFDWNKFSFSFCFVTSKRTVDLHFYLKLAFSCFFVVDFSPWHLAPYCF